MAPGRSSGSIIVDSYILGPGDSGVFTIGPDGVLYLPRARALYVEGLTVEELRYFLQQQFKTNVRRPEVYVRPVSFRPIRVYVGGEVRRPGYYYLSGQQGLNESLDAGAQRQRRATAGVDQRQRRPGLAGQLGAEQPEPRRQGSGRTDRPLVRLAGLMLQHERMPLRMGAGLNHLAAEQLQIRIDHGRHGPSHAHAAGGGMV